MFGGRDPFGMGGMGGIFGEMERSMRHMDRMMGSMMNEMMMDPFAMLRGGGPAMAMLEDGAGGQGRRPTARRNELAHPFMDPFGGFGFGGGLLRQMNELQHAALNDPNSHVFTQSTVMTFDENGRPRVEKKSVRKTGDVKETRRTLQDGDREEVSIGHTIGDRTHVIEKKRDKDGKTRSQQQFINLDEEEAMDFDREFTARAERNLREGPGGVFGANGSSRSRNAIEGDRNTTNGSSRPSANRQRSSGGDQAPIITLPDDDYEDAEERHNRQSSSRTGPIIREISDEEAEQSIPKRRKDMFGRYFRANND